MHKKAILPFLLLLLLIILSACNDNSNEESITTTSSIEDETIFLSENFWLAGPGLFSPIDHDYNIKRLSADFIDSFASDFKEIWWQEMEYQYDKAINSIPEEYREEFALQQSSWEAYYHNDVFPRIAMTYHEDGDFYTGHGFTREAQLIRLDRVRTRTIEIMRLQLYIDDIDTIEFNYQLGDFK